MPRTKPTDHGRLRAVVCARVGRRGFRGKPVEGLLVHRHESKPLSPAQNSVQGPSFENILKETLDEVNNLQNNAEDLQQNHELYILRINWRAYFDPFKEDPRMISNMERSWTPLDMAAILE